MGRINIIKELKDVGLSISQIKDIIEDNKEVEMFLARHSNKLSNIKKANKDLKTSEAFIPKVKKPLISME